MYVATLSMLSPSGIPEKTNPSSGTHSRRSVLNNSSVPRLSVLGSSDRLHRPVGENETRLSRLRGVLGVFLAELTQTKAFWNSGWSELCLVQEIVKVKTGKIGECNCMHVLIDSTIRAYICCTVEVSMSCPRMQRSCYYNDTNA